MDTMTYTTQSLWTWWIAMYLFFGGLGAATLSISFLTDMYSRPHPKLVMWGALSGVVMLGHQLVGVVWPPVASHSR